MLACIIPSMLMSPGSLLQARRGSLDVKLAWEYEASLLVSLTGETEMSFTGQSGYPRAEEAVVVRGLLWYWRLTAYDNLRGSRHR